MSAMRMSLIATGLAALLVGAGVAWWLKPNPPIEPPPLSIIEDMGHLVSVRVNVADVVDFTLPRAVDVPMSNYEIRYGGTTVLLIARGDCLVASDLRLAKYESVDAPSQRLTVLLPLPKTLSARVSHDPRKKGGSQLYSVVNNGLEVFIPDTSNRNLAVEKAYAKAQEKISAVCGANEIVEQARATTEALVKGLYKGVGWTATIKWR